MDFNAEYYDPSEASGTPLQRAVCELGERIDVSESDFAKWTLGEILRRAEAEYGDSLPEFWRTWRDWSNADSSQPMGDL